MPALARAYSVIEPAVKTMLEIADDLDKERRHISEELTVPIGANKIITAVYEFNESPVLP
jgi:ATP-dependent DNA helicase RecQ